jgi:hypothetical protein
MDQRSLRVLMKVYYRSMSYFATVSCTQWPHLQCWAELFHTQWPPLHLMVQVVHIEVTQMGHTDSTQPIAYLIGKQAIPYQTRGGTCCPGGFTPKIQSLADSSMTSHIIWRNPTVYTIPTLLKPLHCSSPQSNHMSTDARLSLTKTQGKLNITKDGRTGTTPMTAWLSITNQV